MMTFSVTAFGSEADGVAALAGAFGGAQSMHTNSYDEVICTPTEDAAKIAVRTQQILQTETGICDVVDALGGSHYLEKETQRIFEESLAEIDRVENMGGMAEAVQVGYPQRAIQESARVYENDFQKGDIAIVGKNKYASGENFEEPESVARELETRRGFEPKQLERLREFKRER
ncbi:MAG: methylmalonyl-CoA mutase family protein, partial [Patescibacteria group bacterium]